MHILNYLRQLLNRKAEPSKLVIEMVEVNGLWIKKGTVR